LPKGESVALFLTFQREPLVRSTYLAGVLVHAKPERLMSGDRCPSMHDVSPCE
jgi:hypothetical protein